MSPTFRIEPDIKRVETNESDVEIPWVRAHMTMSFCVAGELTATTLRHGAYITVTQAQVR